MQSNAAPFSAVVDFTQIAANGWHVDVFDAATAAASGSFPYRSGDLASETVSFNAAGAISAAPLLFVIGGQTLSLSLAGIVQTSGSVSLVAPVEAGANFRPIAGAADLSALPVEDASPGTDAGLGAITFGNTGSTEVLQVNGGVLSNTIADFQQGDSIELAGVALAAQRLSSNASGLLSIPYGGGLLTLQFGADLPGGALFQITPNATGAAITLLRNAFTVFSPAGLAAALAAIGPGGATEAAGALYQITGNAGTIAAASIALDAGSSLTLGGTLAITGSGLTLQSGTTDLDGLLAAAYGATRVLEVGASAGAILSNATLTGNAVVVVDAGGTLDLAAGTIAADTTIIAAGQGLTAAPAQGGSVLIAGDVIGNLHIGTDAGTGGTVTLSGIVTQGKVALDGPATADILSGGEPRNDPVG